VRAGRRLEDRRLPRWARDFPPIDRLSPETSTAIRVAEHSDHDLHSAHGDQSYHVRPGGTAGFLRSYRAFLRRPDPRLKLTASECPSCPGCQYDDVAVIRDALQDVVRVLPPRARAELKRLLTVLDTEFRRRTIPDPDPAHWTDWRGTPYPWWHRRVYAGTAT